MELYHRIIEIVDANLIYCLIPIILTLILVNRFFKERFETRKSLNLFRWIIIIYSIITWTFYLYGMFMNPEKYAFIDRATGPYKVAYWIMFLCALIFPFTLFYKKLASKFWYVLLVAFGMKIGFYFERYVIFVTSLHRDYFPSSESSEFTSLPNFGIGLIFLQGIIIAFLSLGIFEITKRRKTVHNSRL